MYFLTFLKLFHEQKSVLISVDNGYANVILYLEYFRSYLTSFLIYLDLCDICEQLNVWRQEVYTFLDN